MKDRLKAAFVAAAVTVSASSMPVQAAGQDAGIRHFNYTYNYPPNVNLAGGSPRQTVNTSTLYFEQNRYGKITRISPTSAFATAIDAEGYTVPSDKNKNNDDDPRARARVETFMAIEHYFLRHGLCFSTFRQGWRRLQKEKKEPSGMSEFRKTYSGKVDDSVDFCPIFDARMEIAQELKNQGQCAQARDPKGRNVFCGVYLGREFN